MYVLGDSGPHVPSKDAEQREYADTGAQNSNTILFVNIQRIFRSGHILLHGRFSLQLLLLEELIEIKMEIFPSYCAQSVQTLALLHHCHFDL